MFLVRANENYVGLLHTIICLNDDQRPPAGRMTSVVGILLS